MDILNIGVDMGHCLRGYDIGASGCGQKEEVLTRLIGNKVIALLKQRGHNVINCAIDQSSSVNQSLSYRYNKANAQKLDFFICIHLNAYNGAAYGTEVFTYGAKEVPQARKILNNICGLGYTNRGIKDGSGLAVIKNTKTTAMLIECCFIDNSADMKRFDADKMADAIATGLTGQAVAPAAPTKKNGIVTASVLNVRSGASTSYNVIGSYKKGDKVQIARKVGNFYETYFGNHGGWVSADYIK
ncbi:N-acetylmuramoyl-L-alanine amidase [Clostridium estertheticum]|uniref:N-acetylmuramoyl-L-alanine amidase n=1 Tax=Clostridium estertheticum TaxID=238834 RepID=UPI0013EEA0FE|nr:N-acetylmuramoyl-L-alanine amidase [Clostridium estertheticum]MBZ9608621.1 N-acetylmuramoyl-L-alanine amidase [Clostridium estertheticum]